jgi:hypothetical protein
MNIDTKPYRVPSILVDFDDTLFEGNFPDIGPVKPGAKEAMTAFKLMGFVVRIFSCRTNGYAKETGADEYHRDAMVQALRREGIPFDDVVMAHEGKPFSDFVIDDKGIRFSNNWPEIVDMVRQADIGKMAEEKGYVMDLVNQLAENLKKGQQADPKKVNETEIAERLTKETLEG